MYKFSGQIIDSILELLYPKQCMSCGKVLLKIEKEQGFCKACSRKVKTVGGKTCLVCGKPLENEINEKCNQCNTKVHAFKENRAVFIYEGPVKQSIYKLKYFNCRCYGKYFAKYAMKFHGQWIKENGFDAIIPVPMYKKKEQKRGYNQATVFAKELSALTGIPVAEEIVRREIDTTPMKQLKGLKRKKNLLKAFKLAENIVQFRKVLIVDDIYTTGTTIDEVAKALKVGGISEVYGLCICIGKYN